jgi:hypothetical protein
MNEITFYQLAQSIDQHNSNDALKMELYQPKECLPDYHLLKIGQAQTGPMTYTELFYFVKGFRFSREMTA